MHETSKTVVAATFDCAGAARRWAQPLVDTLAGGFVSLYLYGSATTPDFEPGRSDVNLLLVATALPASTMQALAGAWPSGTIGRNPVNLVTVTRAQLERSLDTFALELSDVKTRGMLLSGVDVLADLAIPPAALRAQVERELRLVSVRLRRTFLHTGGDAALLAIELHASVGTLVGCARALATLGLLSAGSNAESALGALARLAGVEERAFLDGWRLRHQRAAAANLSLYLDVLDAVDAVILRVDRHEIDAR